MKPSACLLCLQGGEDLSSEFHNDLFQFSFDKRRWFAAEMRLPKKALGGEDAAATAGSGGGSGPSAADAPSSASGGSRLEATNQRYSSSKH